MFDAAPSGLILVIAWPAIGYLFLGVFIGLYFGAVPGLSGLVGMAILLPFTFSMEPVPALAFLLGMFAVTTTSDTIASVLLGIPGTAASQATILDGYPMAMKGEASRAFGAAFTVSAVGGLLGAVVLGLSIPIVKPLILSFTQAEFFMLGLLGLAMVGSLSGDSILRRLTAALIGLGLSFVGYAENGAVPRYWLGATYLLEGLPLIPVVLGLFALPGVIDLAVRNSSISRVPEDRVTGGMMTGIRDAWRNWWLVLRCTAIGAYVGMLPGLGGSIVDWVAYGHVVQSSKDKEGFGKGGVRAPETANNAMKGGALIELSIVFAARRRKTRRQTGTRIVADLGRTDPAMSLVAVGLLLAVSVYGLAPTFAWPADVGRTPMITMTLAIGLAALALWQNAREVRRIRADGGDICPVRGELGRVAHLYLWWVGVFAAIIVAGQLVALPLFVALYLLVWGRYAWWVALIYAAAAWVFLYVMFDRIVAILWYPSLLFH